MEGSPGSRVSLNGPPPRQYEMDRQEDLLKLIAGIPALPAGDSEATPRQVVNPEKLGRLHEALESHPLRFDVAEEESPQDGDNDHRPDERRQTVSNLAPPALSPSASAQQAQLQVQAQAQAQAQAHASDTESAGISLSASLLSGSTTETREYCLVSGKQQDVQLLSSQGGGADADVPRWRAAATRRRHMHAKQGRELARLARAYVETRTSPLKALITGTPQSQTKTAAATTAAMG